MLPPGTRNPAAAPPPRPLRRDAERNRQRILVAAREAFAEEGLDVSLDEIARRAGVGVGTVYRRFADKEQLIDALFEEQIETVAAMAQAALDEPDAWDGLVGFLERSLVLHTADRGLRELVFGTAHGRERVVRARERMAPLVRRLIERAKASGDLREDVQHTDMPLLHLMLSSVLDFTGDLAPDLARRFLGIVLDGLRTRRDGPTALATGPLDDAQIDRVMSRERSRRACR